VEALRPKRTSTPDRLTTTLVGVGEREGEERKGVGGAEEPNEGGANYMPTKNGATKLEK